LAQPVPYDLPPPSSGASTPILPAHIEDTIRAIAELHSEHHRRATPVQRAVARMTRVVGRPRFVGLLTAAIVIWVGTNILLQAFGVGSFDPPPYQWLQDIAGLLGLYITVLILITQRHEDQLAEHRAQLTLELAILGEQKTAKVIELLEELRRDNPFIADRVDREAEIMAKPADPQAVLEAIKDTHEDMLDGLGRTAEPE
jgi:uncharacterized membrane protein